jgi:GT2 family glycosyltransferase
VTANSNVAASVLVSTRDRPEQVAACVRSILNGRGDDFELLVVDQSSPARAALAQAAVGEDTRLRWIETPSKGLSVSRNIGLAHARAPLIVFTDDDCRVEPDWLPSLQREFAEDPALGLLFGAVLLRPEDRAAGYAAEFEPARRAVFQHAFPDIRRPWGVGANMAIRREVFDRVGTFDELLGAGAPLHAGEETDLTIRALSAGFKLAHTADARVLHLGIRQGADASRILRSYGVGLGATLGKHVRLGTPGALGMLLSLLQQRGSASVANLLRGMRHPGFGVVAAIATGAVRSRSYRLDAVRGVFEP